MVFATRQLQEKHQEQNVSFFTTFVGLTKAFDTVSYDGLWKMHKSGCPDRFITLVRQFHGGMLFRVQDDGESSELFPVTNGLKQSCMMAPILFSMLFSDMLKDSFCDSNIGTALQYKYLPIKLVVLAK